MSRFFRRGLSKVRFAAAIADQSVPTRMEINGATPLSDEVADMGGFQLTNSPIATPDLSTTFTSQIEGEDTTADSTITFYDRTDAAAAAIRAALAKGTSGFILLLPYGDVAGNRMEVWPVKSTGVNDEWTMGNDPARFMVGFAITSPPEQDANVPA